MPGPTGSTATLLKDGRVLFAGGVTYTGAYSAAAELYDPASGTFKATGDLVEPRSHHTATLLPSGRVLILGGGWDKSPSSTTLRRGPSPRPARPSRSGATTPATLLHDGRVLIAGGGTHSSTAELYDPKSGTFRSTGNMATNRADHTATLLQDGRVLVAGGHAGPNGPISGLASAETYDPRSGKFAQTGDMTTGRMEDTATLLPDGSVLFVGGVKNVTEPYLSTAELFN